MSEENLHTSVQRVERCFRRSVETYNQHAVVQRIICGELINLSKEWLPEKAKQVLEIGAGTGLLTERYLSIIEIDKLILNDLVVDMTTPLQNIATLFTKTTTEFMFGDAQTLTLPNNNSIIFSASTFQWFSDFTSFISDLKKIQKSGDLLIFSTFGPKNMIEVCTVCKQGLKYHSLRTLQNALTPHYEILTAKEELRTVWFDTANGVLKHLKYTGVNGIAPQQWTRQTLQQFETDYCQLYQSETGVSLTYHPLYFVCRAK